MNVFILFLGAFHSADAYRFVRAKGGFLIGYSLLVVLACTFAVVVYFTQFIHKEMFETRENSTIFFDDVVRQIASQVPLMTIDNNTLHTQDAVPTTIKISGEAFDLSFADFPIATIDSSGTTTHDSMLTPILITDKDVIFKTDKKAEIKSLSEFTGELKGPLVVNQAVAQSLGEELIAAVHAHIGKIYWFLGGFMWFFIACYMFVMRLIMLLALGLAGLAIASLTKSKIEYASAVGLAALSYTPIAILDTVLFASLGTMTSTLVLFGAGVVALYAAMRISQGAMPPSQQMIG